ncbi:exopolysaccharide biosynthesis polyprenyl glycosylphosphotransferase [Segetibacter sp. 3557_3]|uniref:exopolysaccharide biosynthesis polyprenyl glycosylphosphotransferase n=1 Tax=Segetibacter sp. 3557_3 TaxID=2547429 RepID=UPI00140460EE|nr:exopolysaccharide biosynthesis polyprenyl glycosylphosphotransferase [Segetibacter sp. 3557_3]
MKRDANFFRYSFALFDVLVINLIAFSLIVFMGSVQLTYGIIFFLFANNIAWLVSSYFTALYVEKYTRIHRFLRRSLQCFAIHFAVMQTVIFFSGYDLSRLFVLFNLTGLLIVILTSRILIFQGSQFLSSQPRFNKKVILLGYNQSGVRLADYLSKLPNISIQGYFDDNSNTPPHLWLGEVSAALDYAISNEIDEIYSTLVPEKNAIIQDLALKAERNFIRFKFIPEFRMFVDRKIYIEFARDMPIVSLRREPLEEIGNRIRKSCFDKVFSLLVILLVLSWLVPLLALIIKLDSRGPVFFKQLRSGKNNIPFLCFKFRSLHVNKDADNIQVSKGDQRFTRVGKFLRKSNLDELPQFFNVLRGDMSVVGPRPHMLKHTEEYSKQIGEYMIRHYIKPGITGLAQIQGYRGEITNPEELSGRIKLDIRYLENWSMWYDFVIVVLTVYRTITGDKKAF